MKKTTALQKVRRGAAWMFLPMHAIDSVRNAGGSLARTKKMLSGEDLEDETSSDDAFHVAEGKKLLASLEDRDRFEVFYEKLKWTPEDLSGHLKTQVRTHMVRLIGFWLVVFLMPVAANNFGFMIALFDVASAIFLLAGCIRNTAFIIQLENRALYPFKTVLARPDFWRRCLLTF